ncbi:hypothetical protein C1645_814012 [Glomus cerebriforme]|uniref:Uncharacterized protein n=1 Tax=Glomus cerebriforme TaxID=658196 RepID=A0A397TLV9_9GLOM|nr:hypothetical protein C1645_814012 [Glomus cerebriforme]
MSDNRDYEFQLIEVLQDEPSSERRLRVVVKLKEKLTSSMKAFSLGTQNPLQNIATIKQVHLNVFVHSCLDSTL